MDSRGPARDRLTRILCVNCGICVNRLRRYPALALDTKVTALLCSWVHPQIITDADHVCEACRDLAMFSVNENLHQASGNNEQQSRSRPRGHTEVCLLCGRSIHRRKSDKILRENPTDLHQIMINIIERRVAPRQINETDHLCHPCWLRTQREAQRINTLDNARSPPVASESHEPIQDDLQPSEDVEPSNRPSGSNHPEPTRASNQGLVLPNYRRAANSNSHCVFPNCKSTTLHSISDKLRAIVLSNHHYYLPSLARVCGPHLMVLPHRS